MQERMGLTAREAEVLDAIGRRLSNPEIAAEMVISLRTVESHVAALRRKLGATSRAELRAAARGWARDEPGSLGREPELSAVRGALAAHRLVTLSGPPGVGKSAVARDAVRGRRACRVDVAACGADLAAALASALGAAPSDVGDVSAAALVLEADVDVVLLDDADRRAEECGRLAREVVRATSRTAVLVTSRAPLGLPEEVAVTVRPLSGDPARERAAARLFRERATAAGADADGLDDEVVARLCARLDGLPLAIELAAARCGAVPPAELADLIDDGLGLLESRAAGRHSTLAAAVGWSLEPLDDAERTVLVRLCAVPAPLPIADVEEALGTGAAARALDLASGSLVMSLRHPDGGASLGVLRTVRDIVLAGATAEDVRAARTTWAGYVVQRASRLAADARRDDGPGAHTAWRSLVPQLPGAVDHLLAHDTAQAAALARHIGVLSEQYGPDAATCAALARALADRRLVDAVPTDVGDLVGDALAFGHLPVAAALAAALDERPGGTPHGALARARLHGVVALNSGRGHEALEHLVEAERLAREVGDTWRTAYCLQAQAMAHHDLDDGLAWPLFEKALREYAEAGDAMHVANVRYMMCQLAATSGQRTDEALAWADDGVAYGEERGNAHELAHALLVRWALRTTTGAPLPDPEDLVHARAVFAAVGDARCLARASLALARAVPADDRLPLLRDAWRAAAASRRPDLLSRAAADLSGALVRAGDLRAAGLVLGELAAYRGLEAALDAAPQVDGTTWDALVAEGLARARASAVRSDGQPA